MPLLCKHPFLFLFIWEFRALDKEYCGWIAGPGQNLCIVLSAGNINFCHKKTGDCHRAKSPGKISVYLRLLEISNEPSPGHQRPEIKIVFSRIKFLLQSEFFHFFSFLLVIAKVQAISLSIGCQWWWLTAY